MKQEFHTVRGKLIYDGTRLKIVNFVSKNNSEYYWYAFHLMLIFSFLERGKALPLAYAGLAVFGILLLILLYEIAFLKHLKNTIPLEKIRSFKVLNDHHGLETIVTLKLQSGRTKEIPFRTKEKEYEAFVDLISQQLSTQIITIN